MNERGQPISDSYGRVHDYLRISLTDNCNLRCFYCMPEEDYDFAPHARLMQPAEIEKIAGLFVEHGVRKIRLTGGEPLVRKDAADIIDRLGALPVELTMTTNGLRLHHFVSQMERAGMRSVNISLDTLSEERFKFVTRRAGFRQVMDNIQLMIDRGFHVKVNMVVMKGLNENELVDFVEWTRDVPVHVRFIEFMPFSGNRWTSNQVVTWNDMLQLIGSRFTYEPLKAGANDTARAYQAAGHAGTFAVISTMSAPFCSSCNRMRLTADGKLKNCLFSKGETDLLSAYRAGEDILPLVRQTIGTKAKALGGQFSAAYQELDAREIENRSMITIGG